MSGTTPFATLRCELRVMRESRLRPWISVHAWGRGFVLSALCIGAFVAYGCGDESQSSQTSSHVPVAADSSEPPGFREVASFPFQTLSAYGFFRGDMSELQPVQGVVPYQVTSPLWADHAGKARFVVLPEGAQVKPGDAEEWEFPVGTILIKNFFYSTDRRTLDETVRPIETRLMIRETTDWKGHTYIWNDSLTEATRKVSGKRLNLVFTDETGMQKSQEYIVPNTNQCKDCHERDHMSRPLGLVKRQLDRAVVRSDEMVNQLAWLNEQNIFEDPMAVSYTHLTLPTTPYV